MKFNMKTLHHLNVYLFLLFLLIGKMSTSLSAQNVLCRENHLMLTDSLNKIPIDYFAPGEGGENKLWNISDYLDYSRKNLVYHYRDSAQYFHERDQKQIKYYQLHSDSLFLTSYESPLKKIIYSKPPLQVKYPLCYGDSTGSTFSGIGLYCGNHFYKEDGTVSVKADAFGSLILSEDDTIRNVLRLNSIKSYYMSMDMNAEALDTAKMKQIIEEHYEWYARGYRYPLIETIISTSYANMSPIGTTYQAYCYLPENQRTINDSINKETLHSDSVTQFHQNQLSKDIFHYSIHVNNGTVILNYNLDDDAHIVTMISSSMGIIYRRKEWNKSLGNGYSSSIDCSRLRQGQYVLYINVNGKIYSEKVNI